MNVLNSPHLRELQESALERDHQRLRVAIIIGSTRHGRFAPTVARWFSEQAARRDDLEVDVIDLAEAQLPDILTSTPEPRVEALRQRLLQADAFAVVTPEYNHSFPASL
jgi:NAD(P)H-dependent FMN reductase